MGFRRSLFKGAGFSGEALDRPLIGVVNSWGEISPATKHLNKISARVKAGISSAGGTPVEFVLSGLCDGTCAGAKVANTYNMAWREIAAAYIEAVATANQLDGLVFVSVCDEVVPAHLMAAARLNLPALMVCGGTMVHGQYRGQEIWAGSVSEAFAAREKGTINELAYQEIEDKSCLGAGACGVMGTGNTMQSFAEAIGFTLPGNAVTAGVDPKLERQAYESGRRAVDLVYEHLRPLDVITPGALENGIRVAMAIGGSTNVVLHALSLAREADLPLNLLDFDRLSRETPFICDIQPSGRFSVQRLDQAGGIPAVMKELEPLLHTKAMTVTGKPVLDNIQNSVVLERDVIRTLDNPIEPEGGIAVLYGNLAPNGALIKQSASSASIFRGRAIVFESENDACDAILQELIVPGDVVVIRGMGPRGGPGFPCLYASLWLLKSKSLDDKVALITDGRLSGTIRGIAVANIAPEAAVGGPLALVKNGDSIVIDIENRKLELELTAEVAASRVGSCKKLTMPIARGFMSIYLNTVQQADVGAFLATATGDKRQQSPTSEAEKNRGLCKKYDED